MEVLFDDEDMLLVREGRLVVLATRRAPSPESTTRFVGALLAHAESHAEHEQLFLLVALGAKRPRLDAAVRERIIAAWREIGGRYAVAMWARQKSFAGALQRSFITALALLRINKTPMRLVSSHVGAMEFFETIEPVEASVRDAWRTMLESVKDFREPSD